jgi:hypothetical protein
LFPAAAAAAAAALHCPAGTPAAAAAWMMLPPFPAGVRTALAAACAQAAVAKPSNRRCNKRHSADNSHRVRVHVDTTWNPLSLCCARTTVNLDGKGIVLHQNICRPGGLCQVQCRWFICKSNHSRHQQAQYNAACHRTA